MMQWVVRSAILGVVKEADHEILVACLKWFPNHPGDMDSGVPFPEEDLAANKIEGFFRLPNGDGPTSMILRISNIIRGAL